MKSSITKHSKSHGKKGSQESGFDISHIYNNVVECFAYISMIIEPSKERKITGNYIG
jgi:hypothetical protein